MQIETVILFVGLIGTVCVKLVMLQHGPENNCLGTCALVTLPDFLYFSSVILLIHVAYMFKPRAFIARCALAISGLLLGWSALNIIWLMASGAQLQPGVLMLLLREPVGFWNLVNIRLAKHPIIGISLVAMGTLCLAGFVWLLARPGKVVENRAHHGRWVVATILIIATLFAVQMTAGTNTELGLTAETINFSSHWQALTWMAGRAHGTSGISTHKRELPRVDERQVTLPQYPKEDLPNVVLVLLESISHSATSLGNPDLATTTPYLAKLSQEGVELRVTRVPVSHTTKAFWATLTGSTPVIEPGYSESIVMDQPYEGLPSLLAKVGYRSGFFEMSKGGFECGPGLFHNLAFDWAWFRENLEDPSAYIGMVAGDDFRMIEPALKWAADGTEPFLLAMITTVSHEPFTVPEGYGPVKENREKAYIQSIKFTDDFLERLCRELEERELADNTILCVIGDHGTSIRKKGGEARWHPLEEVIRVPWVIRWPGHIEPGRVIEHACSQMDVTPTILKLIGYDISQAGFDGQDALAASDSMRRCYFSSWYANSPMGFVEGDKKIVYWPYRDILWEYDLDTDPKEENPTQVLAGRKDEFIKDITNWQKGSQINIDSKRFVEVLLFSHWRTFCSGRKGWSYYVP